MECWRGSDWRVGGEGVEWEEVGEGMARVRES